MRLRRRQQHTLLTRLLTLLLVALSLLPWQLGGLTPTPAEAAPAADPAPRITSTSAFGNARPCLAQADTFATTQVANTLYFPLGSRATTITASNMPALSTVTSSAVAPIATLGQLGAVYGIAYDDGIISGRERLFVAPFTKRLVGYGPAGAGGVYVLTRAGTGWSLLGSFQVPGVTAATHSSASSDPSDKVSIAGVGKTSLGDIEVSPDGRTLYIVNIGPKRIERYDLTAATITPSRLTPISIDLTRISTDPAVQANLYPFALENVPAANNATAPFIAVGVTDTAERGTSALPWDYAPGGNFAVSPQVHVLLYNTVTPWWGKILTQDVGNDPALRARHGTSVFAGFIAEWNYTPGRFHVSAWNPWRDNLLALPESATAVTYPQPWLTDIEYLSYVPAVGAPVSNVPYELALGLRDRTGDIAFNANLSGGFPIPVGERGAITQGDLMTYRYNGSAWVHQGERLDDNTHYDPDGTSTSHIENHMGALASIPNAQTGPSTIGESVGSTSLGGLSTQEMRYFASGSGAGASGAITARPQLINMDTHAATKASNLGDMEVLCSYALVGGRVWNDTSNDGTQNGLEGGVAGVVLNVMLPNSSTVLATATTDAQGRYLFAVPPNTSFLIRLNKVASGAAIAGYRLTRQNVGTETTDSDMTRVGIVNQAGGMPVIPFVAPGDTTLFTGAIDAPMREEEGRSYDIGLTRVLPQGRIGDWVWLDIDGDGVQETGEGGYQLPGTVTLDALSSEPGVVDRTATVASNGLYNFGNVVPGTYQLVFPAPPTGYRVSPQNRGTNDALDSDVSATYIAGPVVLVGDENQNQWDFGVVSGADVSIDKTGPATAGAGSQLTYILTARNISADIAPSVTVTDTLPVNLTFVSANPAPSTRVGQVLTWALGNMAANSSRTISVVAQAPTTFTPVGSTTQTVNNCASIGIPTFDPTTSNKSDCLSTTLQRPELGIVKDAPPTALVGDEITYTLTISNSGSALAAGVLVTDTLPTGLTFVRFAANPLGCTATATRVSCPASTMAAGASQVVRFVVRSDPATVPDTVSNTGTVSTSTPGDTPGNNSSTGTTTILRPDLSLTLQITPRPLPVGEPGSVTTTYRNNGTGIARSTVLTVTLDPGVQVGTMPGGCTYTAVTRLASCNLGDVAVGASGTISFPVRLPARPTDAANFAADRLAGTAGISSTLERASTLANNYATDAVDVVRPDVHITATGPDATARLSWGSGFIYTLDYSNRYDANPALTRAAANSVITATLPADVTYVSATTAPSSINGRTLVWNLGTLTAQAAGQIQLTVRTNVPAGTTLHLDTEISTTTPGDVNTITASDPDGDNFADVDTLVVEPPPVVPDGNTVLRLAIHSDLDPKHGGSNTSDAVYLTPAGATRIAWPTGEVLDFTPRLEGYDLPDPGWPLQYRARVSGWGLSSFTNNGRVTAATATDSRGVTGCRGSGGPAAAGSTLQGCTYAYVGAYGEGRTLDRFLPTVTALLESDMATQAHAYWTQDMPAAMPSMRPDVYLFTLNPLEPPRLSVAIEVELWLVNTCPDVLIPPYVCGDPIEMPTPPRAWRTVAQDFDVTLVVPRSVVGPAGAGTTR